MEGSLGMEARRCAEFTGVELIALVEKAVTSPMEKVTAGHSDGEDGPQ
jgi:hypothetical protein